MRPKGTSTSCGWWERRKAFLGRRVRTTKAAAGQEKKIALGSLAPWETPLTHGSRSGTIQWACARAGIVGGWWSGSNPCRQNRYLGTYLLRPYSWPRSAAVPATCLRAASTCGYIGGFSARALSPSPPAPFGPKLPRVDSFLLFVYNKCCGAERCRCPAPAAAARQNPHPPREPCFLPGPPHWATCSQARGILACCHRRHPHR